MVKGEINNKNIISELTEIFGYKSNNLENQNIINRGFVSAKLKKAKALFVGINPSYLSNATNESYLYDIENAVLEYPKHYRKFTELVTNTKYENDWSYIDLFQFRETNQKKIYDFYKNDVEFIVSQLKLTHKIICEINPEIIVVCNSGASDFFGINKIKKSEYWENIWLGYEFEYNKNFGIDIIKGIHNESIIKDQKQHLKNLPILFTSTLTYKSRFDKKRLNWQLNLVAENYNRNEKNNCG